MTVLLSVSDPSFGSDAIRLSLHISLVARRVTLLLAILPALRAIRSETLNGLNEIPNEIA